MWCMGVTVEQYKAEQRQVWMQLDVLQVMAVMQVLWV